MTTPPTPHDSAAGEQCNPVSDLIEVLKEANIPIKFGLRPAPSSPVAAETGTDPARLWIVNKESYWQVNEGDCGIYAQTLTETQAKRIVAELTQAKSEVERVKGELDEAVRKWTDRDFKILELNSALQDAANDFNRQDRALATARAQLAEMVSALDDILNESAVISPEEQVRRGDFVDLQIQAEHYSAGFAVLEKLHFGRKKEGK